MAPTSDDTTAPDERKHRIPKEEYQDIKSNLCEVKSFLRLHEYVLVINTIICVGSTILIERFQNS